MKLNGSGVFYGVSAYVIWGLLPIYWRWLEQASAFEILSHRAVWSLIFCILFLAFQKQLIKTFKLITNFRTLSLLALTSLLLSLNWGIYIWAVSVDRVVEAALGYYITPLVAVSFGVFALKEKLRNMQLISVVLAGIGVLVLTIAYGHLPLVAIGLAISWGSYSLIKKQLNAGALETLSVETIIAFIPSSIYLSYLLKNNDAQFGQELGFSLALVSTGLMTVIPLLFFNAATTRLPLTITGLLQYITPSIMFIIGIVVFHEPLQLVKIVGFLFIWIALAILGRDLYKSGGSIN
ncbi:MAG: EamA family transporter RarD [Actinobacteria bacterium]|nr:EamA family transporter RarD [Actinomycetota bacterium]NBY83012.1 EamA family transporter RarD [Actinomycetota bacterium]NCU77861.1 EamA family transporter RarD [Actinomycetota bacterium]NDD78477.1 EamA family transporter RarD [Actinomycetota bacterium]NDF56444.1 EamA family transporter RarD [Actinomycetota bacterium]